MHTHMRTLRSWTIFGPTCWTKIEAFFVHYNQQKGKAFKPLKRCGPKKARKIIEHGMAVFLKKHPNGHEKAE